MIKELDYKIIGSSSKGNAVRIENIMFDCGMPYGKMKEELYKCRTLCITHHHKDHVNAVTLHRIIDEFPRIEIVGNSTVAYKHHVNTIVNDTIFKTKTGIRIQPFPAIHDVETTGYIVYLEGCSYVYITDTSEIVLPEEKEKFDYLFIESNYDEKKLKEVSKQYRKGSYDPFVSNQRHLSTQQCKAFYYTHRKSRDSVLIELHKSSRFY